MWLLVPVLTDLWIGAGDVPSRGKALEAMHSHHGRPVRENVFVLQRLREVRGHLGDPASAAGRGLLAALVVHKTGNSSAAPAGPPPPAAPPRPPPARWRTAARPSRCSTPGLALRGDSSWATPYRAAATTHAAPGRWRRRTRDDAQGHPDARPAGTRWTCSCTPGRRAAPTGTGGRRLVRHGRRQGRHNAPPPSPAGVATN